MNVDPCFLGGIHRRRGRAIINKGQPAGIAVGENINGGPLLAAADLADQLQAVATYAPAIFGILVGLLFLFFRPVLSRFKLSRNFL